MEHRVFADRMKEAMARRGMKQIDLIRAAEARGTRLGKSQVSQYVSGKTIPRKDVLDALAAVLDVEAGWLCPKRDDDAMWDSGVADAPEAAASAQRTPASAACAAANAQNAAASAGRTSATVSAVDGEDTVDASTCAASDGNPDDSETHETNDSEQARSGKMREFKKSSKLDNVLYDVRGPVADEAHRMEEAGTHILKLNIGNPAPFGFRTPDEVIYDMRRQLTDVEGYSDAKGLFSARKAIMQYAQLKHIPNVSMSDVYTGNGVSELINICLSALVDTGDEVLVPSPDYPLWTACVNLAGGTAVHYVCDEEAEWYPDMDDIRSKITSRTKAIVVINPNNPTGALYPRELLQEIVDVAREHNLLIFSDEIYDRLVMDGLEHVSIASMAPDLFCITFSGLSKSHMIAGYRIGWMVLSGDKRGAEDYIEGINMLCNMRMCSNTPAQSIVQTALGGHQSVKGYVAPGGRVLEQRDYVYEALNSIPGVSAVKPKAGFYIFPKLDVGKFNITDDEQFALDFLHDKKILVTHGSGFNWKKPDHFRVVFLPRIEVLEEAMEKLADFLSYYRQR